MTRTQALDFMRSLIGRVRYELGADDITDDANGMALDCSAAIWRGLGQRKFDGKRWRNTDWIVGDATGAQTQFVLCGVEILPGDVAVYGRAQNGGKVGHVAFVADPAKRTILDCSSSRNGIAEHDGGYFWRRAAKGQALFVRWKGWT